MQGEGKQPLTEKQPSCPVTSLTGRHSLSHNATIKNCRGFLTASNEHIPKNKIHLIHQNEKGEIRNYITTNYGLKQILTLKI